MLRSFFYFLARGEERKAAWQVNRHKRGVQCVRSKHPDLCGGGRVLHSCGDLLVNEGETDIWKRTRWLRLPKDDYRNLGLLCPPGETW